MTPSAPKAYLQTTGDLFAAPDQGAEEKLVVKMGSAQLVSPAWNQSRPWLTGSWLMQYPADFVAEVGGATDSAGGVQLPPACDLSAAAPTQQEAALVDDLMGVFLGQAGQYVVHAMVEGPKWQRLALQVKGVTEPSLVEQVERLLPLCECVYIIKRFVETRSRIDHPKVAQALAAAMRELQREWWLVVVQLDHLNRLGQLSLASLVYYCREPTAFMQLLASIAGEAADKDALTSAGLLNLLAAKQRSLAGDRPGQVLLGRLLEAAAEPYFGILEKWLCRGELDDPYHEFMVKEDADVSRDSLSPDGQPAYWSQRYRLRGAVTAGHAGSRSSQHDVPEFLNSSKEAIVVTGKYLNVIRQCGQPVPPCPESTVAKLRYSAAAGDSGSPPFLQGIQEALSAAAGALLRLLCGPGPQGRLLSWLHCMKHFFLMDQVRVGAGRAGGLMQLPRVLGDLLVHLMEQPEMQEPPSCLAPHQLQGLLDAATRSSSVAASPHIDVVGEGVLAGQMDRRSLLQLVMAATCSMDGEGGGAASSSVGILPKGASDSTHSSLELLLLTVNLSWPISLVVSKRQLLHYQVIFKQLLSLKWAERDLGQAWQSMRATKRLSGEDQQRWRAWHMLCSQLTYVVGEVLRFTSIDVLEPLWGDMEARLLGAGNMDEVICLHNAFLSAALQRCLLTETHMVRHISVLLQAAHGLAKEVAGLTDCTTGASSSSSSSTNRRPGQPQQRQPQQQQQPQVNGLLVMSKFCQDEQRQAQLKALQDRVSDVLQRLVRDLNIHYQALLTAAPAGGAGTSAGAGFGGTAGVGSLGGRLAGLALDGGWGSGAAGAAAAAAAGGGVRGSLLGDSSRDLASLHNLTQRLEMGCHMAGGAGAQQRAWPAAY
ncbi:Spc98 family-domain-containing protein [Scenedesmus sp. NREL 46B-D3]|nr:Spc98 family-domain-containing protein [Scenedesmus sp. NREL 46B-D3]